MAHSHGLKILSIAPKSPLKKLKAGDTLLKINGNNITDLIDYLFYTSTRPVELSYINSDGIISSLSYSGKADLGLELEPLTLKECKNKCVFCYVDQLPKNMRETLYVKDDDYRLSFLHGNYITMSNTNNSDIERIISQRLSPLYISVHATDENCRKILLGNKKLTPILHLLEKFASSRIMMHIQIVTVPGINDGETLKKTLNDISVFFPYVSSIAVVLVGITKYSQLKPVNKEEAQSILKIVKYFQKKFIKQFGSHLVYPSDDLLLKACAKIPPIEDFEELPQFENGVGMLSNFIAEFNDLLPDFTSRDGNTMLVTGEAFAPYLTKMVKQLETKTSKITVVPVKNRLFGETVSVTGLLGGRDIINSILHEYSQELAGADQIILPSILINQNGLLIDNLNPKHIKEELKKEIKIINPTAEALLDFL